MWAHILVTGKIFIKALSKIGDIMGYLASVAFPKSRYKSMKM
jgi:hypothetical protein